MEKSEPSKPVTEARSSVTAEQSEALKPVAEKPSSFGVEKSASLKSVAEEQSLMSLAALTSLKKVVLPVRRVGKTEVKKNLPYVHHTIARENVLSHIISLWDNGSLIRFDNFTRQIESDPDFFKMAATPYKFQMLQLQGEIRVVEKSNLPAILGFASPKDGSKGYIVVVEITAEKEYIIFPGNGDSLFSASPDDLEPFLTGDVHIPWKDDIGPPKVVSGTAPKSSILALKRFLSQMGFPSIDFSPEYNDPVKEAVRQIQAKYGLVEDGILGPYTKIMLYNEKWKGAAPCLDQTRFESGQKQGR